MNYLLAQALHLLCVESYVFMCPFYHSNYQSILFCVECVIKFLSHNDACVCLSIVLYLLTSYPHDFCLLIELFFFTSGSFSKDSLQGVSLADEF